MKLDTVKKIEILALNVEIAPSRRAFDAGILLMTYESLRMSHVRRLRILDVDEDSIRATLLQSKTKNPTAYRGRGRAIARASLVPRNGSI